MAQKHTSGTVDKQVSNIDVKCCWLACTVTRKEPCLCRELQNCQHAHNGYSSAFSCAKLRNVQLTSDSHNIKGSQ